MKFVFCGSGPVPLLREQGDRRKWIHNSVIFLRIEDEQSRPSRARGLKPFFQGGTQGSAAVAPPRARGLKRRAVTGRPGPVASSRRAGRQAGRLGRAASVTVAFSLDGSSFPVFPRPLLPLLLRVRRCGSCPIPGFAVVWRQCIFPGRLTSVRCGGDPSRT